MMENFRSSSLKQLSAKAVFTNSPLAMKRSSVSRHENGKRSVPSSPLRFSQQKETPETLEFDVLLKRIQSLTPIDRESLGKKLIADKFPSLHDTMEKECAKTSHIKLEKPPSMKTTGSRSPSSPSPKVMRQSSSYNPPPSNVALLNLPDCAPSRSSPPLIENRKRSSSKDSKRRRRRSATDDRTVRANARKAANQELSASSCHVRSTYKIDAPPSPLGRVYNSPVSSRKLLQIPRSPFSRHSKNNNDDIELPPKKVTSPPTNPRSSRFLRPASPSDDRLESPLTKTSPRSSKRFTLIPRPASPLTLKGMRPLRKKSPSHVLKRSVSDPRSAGSIQKEAVASRLMNGKSLSSLLPSCPELDEVGTRGRHHRRTKSESRLYASKARDTLPALPPIAA